MKDLKTVLSKKNALYIHGLNSDINSSTYNYLKNGFPEFNWFSDTFDLLDVNKTIDKINNLLTKHNISIVVGSSLGAFYTLYIKNSLAKIVINPCMHPSIEVPKLEELSEDIIKKFEALENETYSSIDPEMRISTFGVFGKNDELFSYKDEFKKKYGKDLLMVRGGHRLDKSTLLSSVQYGLSYFDHLNKILRESVVNEHFVNIVTTEDESNLLHKYKDQVYDMLMKAYAPIGGILGCDNVDMLVDDSDFWKLFIKNGKLCAVAVYTFKRGGRKLMYCGTDGTSQGKDCLMTIIGDDLRLKDRNAWAEVSDKMEHIYINKKGATPVPAEIAQKIMKDKPFVKIHDDGFHYDRIIGGEVHTKIMVGNV
jgi:predicted esterase YcpF (UPF0227 family)